MFEVQVYQLCDPHPLTLNQMLSYVDRSLHKRYVAPKLPMMCVPLLKAAIRYVPFLGSLMHLTPEQCDYMVRRRIPLALASHCSPSHFHSFVHHPPSVFLSLSHSCCPRTTSATRRRSGWPRAA